jgi:hypothetical protein
MKAEDIQKKFPEQKVKRDPLKDCPTCKGEGVFTNTLGKQRPCLCVCLGPACSDETRRNCVLSFRKAIASMRLR